MGLGSSLAKIGGIGANFIPGVGPLLGIGLGVGGGLLGSKLAGGGDKKSSSTAAIDPYTAALQKQADVTGAEGQQSNAMGSDALAPVMKYLQSILSGNPSDVLAATQPERGRVIDQYDTARKAVAEFGPRGGGTTSTAAQSRFDQASSLADITSSARRDAVATEGQLGLQLKQLGLTAEQLKSADLNSIINAVLNKQYLDVQKRGQTAGLLGDIGSAAGSVIGAILTRKAA